MKKLLYVLSLAIILTGTANAVENNLKLWTSPEKKETGPCAQE